MGRIVVNGAETGRYQTYYAKRTCLVNKVIACTWILHWRHGVKTLRIPDTSVPR